MRIRIIFLATLFMFFDDTVYAKSFTDMLKRNCIVDNRQPSSLYDTSAYQQYQQQYKNAWDAQKSKLAAQYLQILPKYRTGDIAKRSFEDGENRRQTGVIYGDGRPIGILQPYHETFKFMPLKDDDQQSHYSNIMYPLARFSRRSEDALQRAEMEAEKVAFMDKEYPSLLVDFKIHNKMHTPEFGNKGMSVQNNKREIVSKILEKVNKKREINHAKENAEKLMSKRSMPYLNNHKRGNGRISKMKKNDVTIIEKDLRGLLTDIGLMEDHLDDKADEMENTWHQQGEAIAEDEDLEESYARNDQTKIKSEQKDNVIPDRKKRAKTAKITQRKTVNDYKELKSNGMRNKISRKRENGKLTIESENQADSSACDNCPKPSVIPNKKRATKPTRGIDAPGVNQNVPVTEKFETSNENHVSSTESYEEYEQRMARAIKEKIRLLKEEVKREIGMIKDEKSAEDEEGIEEMQRKKRFITGPNTLIDEESQNIDPNENIDESLIPHVRKRRSYKKSNFRLNSLSKVSVKNNKRGSDQNSVLEDTLGSNDYEGIRYSDTDDSIKVVDLSGIYSEGIKVGNNALMQNTYKPKYYYRNYGSNSIRNNNFGANNYERFNYYRSLNPIKYLGNMRACKSPLFAYKSKFSKRYKRNVEVTTDADVENKNNKLNDKMINPNISFLSFPNNSKNKYNDFIQLSNINKHVPVTKSLYHTGSKRKLLSFGMREKKYITSHKKEKFINHGRNIKKVFRTSLHKLPIKDKIKMNKELSYLLSLMNVNRNNKKINYYDGSKFIIRNNSKEKVYLPQFFHQMQNNFNNTSFYNEFNRLVPNQDLEMLTSISSNKTPQLEKNLNIFDINKLSNLAVFLNGVHRFKRALEKLNNKPNYEEYSHGRKRRDDSLIPYAITAFLPYRENEHLLGNPCLDMRKQKNYASNCYLIRQNNRYANPYIYSKVNNGKYSNNIINKKDARYYVENKQGFNYRNYAKTKRKANLKSSLTKSKKRRRSLDLFNTKQRHLEDMSENELFGALPRSYDGGLSRYKRV